jgi:hypothetical protein
LILTFYFHEAEGVFFFGNEFVFCLEGLFEEGLGVSEGDEFLCQGGDFAVKFLELDGWIHRGREARGDGG